MKIQKDFRELSCAECVGDHLLDFDFTMAFQPIVNTSTRSIFAHEALARGPGGEPAGWVFQHVNDSNRYRFDQSCRVKAIKLAAELGMDCVVSINFMPNAVYRPELCIRTTVAAAETYNFPLDRIILEITESEKVEDQDHLRGIIEHYKQRGLITAIDDFGAGYSGLNMLADMQPDFIKLDMALIRNIDKLRPRQAIVKGILQTCKELSIKVIAEGVETRDELSVLKDMGIELFQGFYFAKPAFQSLARVDAAAYA